MADGMDRLFALKLGIPPFYERCTRCQSWAGDHQCGFFYGRFDGVNWRCATLVGLQQLAAEAETLSSEHGVVSAVVADPRILEGYALLTWHEESPQRVSSALWFDTEGKASGLTVEQAERLLAV